MPHLVFYLLVSCLSCLVFTEADATNYVGKINSQTNREWSDFNKPYKEAAAHELK
jgi:hypothetical protein